MRSNGSDDVFAAAVERAVTEEEAVSSISEVGLMTVEIAMPRGPFLISNC